MKSAMGYLAGLFAVSLFAGAAIAAGPKSIFDDDWVPPKRDTPKYEAPQPKPVAPSSDPVVPPKDPAAVAPAARRAVPARDEQAGVRKLLKELFAEQLGDKSAAGRKKLAENLLGQAEKSADAPVDQFVLLAAGIDAAREASNLPLAFTAASRMGALFDVDVPAVKAQVVGQLAGPQLGAGEGRAANVGAALGLVDELVESDQYAAAARVCAALVPLVAGNAAQRADLQKRQKELEAGREASEKVARSFEKLKAAPEDGAANLEVGKYLCFFKNNWPAGLAALTRGSDAPLKALAEKELNGAESAEARLAIGDGWWDVSQGVAGRGQAAVQAHAAEWYRKASPELKGLNKVKVEKRLTQLDMAVAPANNEPRVNYLSEMKEVKAEGYFNGNGWYFAKDVLNQKKDKITVKGVVYEHGLAMNHGGESKPLRITYDLGRRYGRLVGAAAINDTANGFNGKMTYSILGDDVELWKSRPLTKAGEFDPFELKIGSVSKLELVIVLNGGGFGAHCVWLELRLAAK